MGAGGAPEVLPPVQRREAGIAQSLGRQLAFRVKRSRVLLVGAGGIGCELLKNLVCSGFGTAPTATATTNVSSSNEATQNSTQRLPEIVVVDLDTIDLSNLNRQFLFRKRHIKKPKAIVAKETAGQFNPAARIDAHHASIFDDQYDVDFFAGFDLVFNALDNLAARRHVNRMCLAANVPLIESGTTGFNGQVQAIQKGVTECYDCNPKPVQKSFPICTIRSTPSQPIHCIVWAKSYLFPELFGASGEESTDMAQTEGDDAEEVEKLREEANALQKIRQSMQQPDFVQLLFNKIFSSDIERLRSMTEMWQNRRPPAPLKFDNLSELASVIKQGYATSSNDQNPWTMLENINVFCYSLDALSKRVAGGETTIDFDKDDKDTLDFVASAANLRSHIFGIPMHSEWEIKQMAGNIIPAIATSNAIAASLCVLESFKFLRHRLTKTDMSAMLATKAHISKNAQIVHEPRLGGAKEVFLASRNTERMITSHFLSPPNPTCAVCSPVYARLIIPQDKPVLLSAVVNLLKERVGYEDFSIVVDKIGVIYDADLDDNLSKPLSDFGVDGNKNVFLVVQDDSDTAKVDLVLSVKARGGEPRDASQPGTELPTVDLSPSTIELPFKRKPISESEQTNGNAHTSAPSNMKRKRGVDDDDDLAAPSVAKRARPADDVTVIEDDDVIVLGE